MDPSTVFEDQVLLIAQRAPARAIGVHDHNTALPDTVLMLIRTTLSLIHGRRYSRGYTTRKRYPMSLD